MKGKNSQKFEKYYFLHQMRERNVLVYLILKILVNS